MPGILCYFCCSAMANHVLRVASMTLPPVAPPIQPASPAELAAAGRESASVHTPAARGEIQAADLPHHPQPWAGPLR
jgi:hypothetical protein